jgi:hypothetical protein
MTSLTSYKVIARQVRASSTTTSAEAEGAELANPTLFAVAGMSKIHGRGRGQTPAIYDSSSQFSFGRPHGALPGYASGRGSGRGQGYRGRGAWGAWGDRMGQGPRGPQVEKLLAQMRMGFDRRDEAFVQQVFDRHRTELGIIPRTGLNAALQGLGLAVNDIQAAELDLMHGQPEDSFIDLAHFRSIVSRNGQVEQWASTLPLAQLLADCMPVKDVKDPLRAVSKLSAAEVPDVVASLSEGLARLLRQEIANLNRAYETMDSKVNEAAERAKPAKYKLEEGGQGGMGDFYRGLPDGADDPQVDLESAMEAEHSSERLFSTSNYGIETCASHEWRLAVHHELALATGSPVARIIPRIEDLLQHPVAISAALNRVEVIAIVLYTGPMYTLYNCVLREHPADLMKALKDEGTLFGVTICVLISAVQKLALATPIPDSCMLYRGMGRIRDLPGNFFTPNAQGIRGFTELAFMSTTSEKNRAMYYSSQSRAHDASADVPLPVLLEVTSCGVDRPACVAQLSQYPAEAEYLWAPRSFVAPAGPERREVDARHGVVRILPVRVNSNVSAPTAWKLIRHAHRQASVPLTGTTARITSGISVHTSMSAISETTQGPVAVLWQPAALSESPVTHSPAQAAAVSSTMAYVAGLRHERKDGQDTLEYNEEENTYVCSNADGQRVQCMSVTSMLEKHVFPSSEFVLEKCYDRWGDMMSLLCRCELERRCAD